MSIAKDKGAIKKFSGGIWKVCPLSDEEAGLKAADSAAGGSEWLDLGYVQEATLNDSTETEDVMDETGGVVNTDELSRTVKITGLLMQTDKELIDFLKETVRGKYYAIYHYDGINNGKYQDYHFGICQIKPMIEIASGTKRIPFEISVLKNTSLIPVNGSGEGFITTVAKGSATTDAYNIAANTYYTLAETTVS